MRLRGLIVLVHVVLLLILSRLQDVVQHLGHFLRHKRHAPTENVQKVRQQVRVLRIRELLDVQGAVIELQNCSLVVVNVAVVRRAENRDHCWKLFGVLVVLVETVTFQLSLVSPDQAYELVGLQQRLDCPVSKEPAAAPHLIPLVLDVDVEVVVLDWVRPQQVAEEPCLRGLPEAVDSVDV